MSLIFQGHVQENSDDFPDLPHKTKPQKRQPDKQSISTLTQDNNSDSNHLHTQIAALTKSNQENKETIKHQQDLLIQMQAQLNAQMEKQNQILTLPTKHLTGTEDMAMHSDCVYEGNETNTWSFSTRSGQTQISSLY